MITRSVNIIFETLSKSGDEYSVKVLISHLEIYNEELCDLLNPDNKNLKIYEERDHVTFSATPRDVAHFISCCLLIFLSSASTLVYASNSPTSTSAITVHGLTEINVFHADDILMIFWKIAGVSVTLPKHYLIIHHVGLIAFFQSQSHIPN